MLVPEPETGPPSAIDHETSNHVSKANVRRHVLRYLAIAVTIAACTACVVMILMPQVNGETESLSLSRNHHEHIAVHKVKIRLDPEKIKEEGGHVDVPLRDGQIFVIELPGNPTTGYAWMAYQYNSTVIAAAPLPSDEEFPVYIPSKKHEGGAGVYVFRFKAVAAGSTTLELWCKRGWEVHPLEVLYLDVVVVPYDHETRHVHHKKKHHKKHHKQHKKHHHNSSSTVDDVDDMGCSGDVSSNCASNHNSTVPAVHTNTTATTTSGGVNSTATGVPTAGGNSTATATGVNATESSNAHVNVTMASNAAHTAANTTHTASHANATSVIT
eukprot:GFYU01002108.1.p1 GENE.GFYU01002108.1~~GFYU01002108.1.p1  ORF type:complete len:327 (-),score=42.72 GFYU01002108.1:66-1046(-)